MTVCTNVNVPLSSGCESEFDNEQEFIFTPVVSVFKAIWNLSYQNIDSTRGRSV